MNENIKLFLVFVFAACVLFFAGVYVGRYIHPKNDAVGDYRTEYNQQRQKYNELEQQYNGLKSEIAAQGQPISTIIDDIGREAGNIRANNTTAIDAVRQLRTLITTENDDNIHRLGDNSCGDSGASSK
jgi:hypothetical protein